MAEGGEQSIPDIMKKKVSRRDFLRILGLGAAGAALAACDPKGKLSPEINEKSETDGYVTEPYGGIQGKSASESLKEAYVQYLIKTGVDQEKANEARKFYSEVVDTSQTPTLKVLFIEKNEQGQVSKVVVSNHWKAFFGFMDDKNESTSLTDEINNMFSGKGEVAVSAEDEVRPFQKRIEEAHRNLAPGAKVRGAIIDSWAGEGQVKILDGNQVAEFYNLPPMGE